MNENKKNMLELTAFILLLLLLFSCFILAKGSIYAILITTGGFLALIFVYFSSLLIDKNPDYSSCSPDVHIKRIKITILIFLILVVAYYVNGPLKGYKANNPDHVKFCLDAGYDDVIDAGDNLETIRFTNEYWCLKDGVRRRVFTHDKLHHSILFWLGVDVIDANYH